MKVYKWKCPHCSYISNNTRIKKDALSSKETHIRLCINIRDFAERGDSPFEREMDSLEEVWV